MHAINGYSAPFDGCIHICGQLNCTSNSFTLYQFTHSNFSDNASIKLLADDNAYGSQIMFAAT